MQMQPGLRYTTNSEDTRTFCIDSHLSEDVVINFICGKWPETYTILIVWRAIQEPNDPSTELSGV